MSLLARVAKWQTRWLQVPVFERTWGFKSPLAHQTKPPHTLGAMDFNSDGRSNKTSDDPSEIRYTINFDSHGTARLTHTLL